MNQTVEHEQVSFYTCATCDHVYAVLIISDRMITVAPGQEGLTINVFHPVDRQNMQVVESPEGKKNIVLKPSDSFIALYDRPS